MGWLDPDTVPTAHTGQVNRENLYIGVATTPAITKSHSEMNGVARGN